MSGAYSCSLRFLRYVHWRLAVLVAPIANRLQVCLAVLAAVDERGSVIADPVLARRNLAIAGALAVAPEAEKHTSSHARRDWRVVGGSNPLRN